jgi:putative membrane protein
MAAVLAAGAAYWWGAARLAARSGRHWSPARTVCFLAGLAVILVATQPPVGSEDTRRFAVHAIQHLLLSMVAPPLLALGAPVTLALQSSRRATQRRLLRALHSRPVAAITHPAVGWLLLTGSMFALYFSSLYSYSLRHPLVHDLIHLHFVVAGVLFFWPVVGIDPSRWRLPYGGRLLYVLLTIPVHAFLGIALLTGTTPLYRAHSLADQHAGGGIMWAAGELVTLATAAVILAQWVRADQREAARLDRLADAAGALSGDGLAAELEGGVAGSGRPGQPLVAREPGLGPEVPQEVAAIGQGLPDRREEGGAP